MPKELKYIAQQAWDSYEQDYPGNTTFFTLEDWIQWAGGVLGEYYLNEFRAQYAEIRQEKRDEVVSFATDILNDMVLEVVKDDNGEYSTKEKVEVFAFPYDKQNSGYQNVFIINPGPRKEAIRANINELWQFEYAGTINRIFWYPENGKIKFVKQGFCNVKEIKLFYVPSISENMMVPDGLINFVRTKTVENAKIAANQVVVKESNNQNKNATIETEMDKSQLTPQK